MSRDSGCKEKEQIDKFENLDRRIKSVLEKLEVLPNWMFSRTRLCKHKYGCYENVIIGFYETFVYSLAVKSVINNLSYLTNIKKLMRNLKSWKSNRDNLRFAFFLALMNALYKLVLCVLRRFLKNDKYCAPIAGFVAGLASFLDAKARRQFATVLLLSRLTDTCYSMAEDRGYVKRYKYGELALFMFCNMTQQYAMAFE